MKIRSLFTSIALLFAWLSSGAQQTNTTPEFLKYTNHRWVDSVFNSLSVDEKIAQLIVVAAYSNRGEEHTQEILKLIREQKIG
jgi:beta-N-acetylhexosaminidase